MSKSSKPSNEYLSSKDAGAQLGYTHDYISRLCRQGKMSGIQKGREWFVTQNELDVFIARHKIELEQKKKELSKKFSRIRTEYEAKKRKAREEAKLLQHSIKTDTSVSNDSSSQPSIQKRVKFSIPNQFIAVGVLTALLFGSTIFEIISSTPVTFQSEKFVSNDFSLKDISENIEQGIQDTIYAQSTVVEPVAAVFAFMPYLADGYWQFFTVVGQLPKAMYLSLDNIGNRYLTLYVLQGEALYKSALNLNTMGANVLQGYELIGESFYVGSKDIINIYARVLNLDSHIQTSIRGAQSFTANVSGGFEYAQEQVEENFIKTVANQITSLGNLWIQNIKTNVSSMQSNISQISHDMSAYVGTLFTFDLINKESKIRSIKIKNQDSFR